MKLLPQYQQHLNPETKDAIEDVCRRWVYPDIVVSCGSSRGETK
jgi:hypothetical protein